MAYVFRTLIITAVTEQEPFVVAGRLGLAMNAVNYLEAI
jgi:hypothetical protein